MPALSLRAQRLCIAFGDRRLVDDATFHLAPGWTGLVGPNGAGKTTLLEVLAGLRAPDSGQVRLTPERARVCLCAQRVDTASAEVQLLADTSDGEGRALKASLRLAAEQLARWDSLSAGERKRWQIGAALASDPQVLLLDEPTNHLDGEARSWLLEALRAFRGVGVLVSHDRALLDDLTVATLKLEHGEVASRPQPFSAARAGWDAEGAAVVGAQREARRRLEHEAKALDDAKRRHEASTRSRSAGARMKGRHDSDGRGMGADYRAATAEAAHAAALRRTSARASAVEARLAELQVRDDGGRALFFRDEPCPRPVVVALHGDVPRPDGTPLLSGVSLQLARGAHVHVTGPNGAGKSTLLAALLERAALPEEHVVHLPQELTPEDAEGDLEQLRALPPDERGRVLQLVAALGVAPAAVLATSAPSPGEARKLRLALGLGRSAWLAALDEPTNHLDLPSIERLEEALAAFPGALLLVTHDEALARRVTGTRWAVRDGGVEG